MSRSYEGRKDLTNSLLISKVNYHLSFLFGLNETNFKGIQSVIDSFIFDKRVYPGKGKYCSKNAGGLGSPNIYSRYITAQLQWIRKICLWDETEIEDLPSWLLPFKIALDKYSLPKFKVLFAIGNSVLSYLIKICEYEKLNVIKEILLTLLSIRKRYENSLRRIAKRGPPYLIHPHPLFNSLTYIGQYFNFTPRYQSVNPDEWASRPPRRPPDAPAWLRSPFMAELQKSKLDILNVAHLNPETFRQKAENLEGFNEEIFSLTLKMLKQLNDKNTSATPGRVTSNSLRKFLIFNRHNNCKKPGQTIMDLAYSNRILIEKWNKLNIERIIPISMDLIRTALKSNIRNPPRAANYRLELILASVRTEKHIAKITGAAKRPCPWCNKEDNLQHIIMFCAMAQTAWTSMAMRYKQLTGGEEIIIDTSLIFLGLSRTNKKFRNLANRLAATTAHWILKTYYGRGPMLKSRRIGLELHEMFTYEDRIFRQRNDSPKILPTSWSIDAEIDTNALVELISSLSEDDLNKGEANMIIHLRNAMGRLCSPSLIREEGYISIIPASSNISLINNRKIDWDKLLFLMRLDAGD